MNREQSRKLARMLRSRREELGLSASQLARRANVAVGTVTRIELAQIPAPKVESLRSIADALDLPITDLLATAALLRDDELPTMPVYLKLKYRDMSPETVAEINRYVESIMSRHEHAAAGPTGGEDE